MKKFIAALIIAAALGGRAYAASTGTAQGVDLDGINYRSLVDVPAEYKVVEIHMTRTEPEAVETKIVKSRRQVPYDRHGTCSGSFIDDRGDVLTAKHCVTDFDKFEVQTYDHRHYAAVVVATSSVHDLALIHIAKYNTPYFKLAEDVERGEEILTLGSPLGITDVVTEGIIAKIDGDDVLLDCGVLPGNSGGPVLNSHFKLVAVVIAGYIVGMGTTHLNVAQSLDNVRFFLEEVAKNRK